MKHINSTLWNSPKINLNRLRTISNWLADNNELPSSGDAVCVMEAVDEIERLSSLIGDLVMELEQRADTIQVLAGRIRE